MWKAIPGYVGIYEASDCGQIRSIDRYVERAYKGTICRHFTKGTVLKQTPTHRGYLQVTLCKDGETRQRTVHQFIAHTFLGPPNGRMTLHDNDIGTDNALSNLRYGTGSDNAKDAERNGRKPQGSKHPAAILKDADIRKIRNRLALGYKPREIAGMFGVTREAISDIKNGRGWSHM